MDTDTITLTNQGRVAAFYNAKMGRNPTTDEAWDRLDEEIDELIETLNDFSKSPVMGADVAPHLLKEMTDVIYTLHGFAIANGWDLDRAFEATHRSNMTKEKTTAGKVRKGENYVEPNMEQFIG